MLAQLSRVLGGGEDDESEERGVCGAVCGNGEERRTRVLLRCTQDVVCCANGEVTWG